MTEYEVHGVGYSDTTEEDWDDPQLNDFETEDLGEVADHFLLSSSGFPPESFSDLRILVVDREGNLDRNALQTAYSGGHGVEGIDDITGETVEEVRDRPLSLAGEGFGIGEDELEEPPS